MRAVSCIAMFLFAGVAHAQGAGEQRWLFVPVLTGDLARTPPAALAASWEAAMRVEGDLVIANESGGTLVESKHSSEPIRVDDKRLEELVRIIDEGQQHLSRADREKAQEALRPVSGPEREFLRRDPERARKLFDVCMMTAALLLKDRKAAEAEHQVSECADGFPAFFPPKRKGPPPFQALVARVQKQRDREPSGMLAVTSDPPGCAVRLNGGAVGTTPASITNVGVGIVHVQIECDPKAPGRTHAITIRVGDNRLEVDSVLEAALHTRDGLWLSFPDDEVRQQHARRAGERLSHVLGDPRTVLLVFEGKEDEIVAQPIPLFAGARALQPVRWRAARFDENALRADVRALRAAFATTPKPTPTVQRRQEPARGAASAELDEERGARRATQLVTRSTWPGVVAGATTMVVGVGAIAVSWVVYAQRQSIRLELRPEVEQAVRSDFDGRGPWVIGAGVVGSLGLTAALPFLLPKASGVPTWAWMVGALGVAVAGTGVGYSIFERHCAPAAGATASGCRRFTADATFGPLLALHGLPLLAVPGTYLIRGWLRPARDIQVGFEGGGVVLRGSF